ncbi:hypothetical protein EYF80_020528 [Liparis tanakae]|uniref:Secreted protein n=1 Tax=Liparis tanakae TaxID=230148 RepID=A0A4Z2HUJ3_9TELE|nr:hypothetical protein EYF80_020528 [Liparis tanakae]
MPLSLLLLLLQNPPLSSSPRGAFKILRSGGRKHDLGRRRRRPSGFEVSEDWSVTSRGRLCRLARRARSNTTLSTCDIVWHRRERNPLAAFTSPPKQTNKKNIYTQRDHFCLEATPQPETTVSLRPARATPDEAETCS